jgi:hypothetical protein
MQHWPETGTCLQARRSPPQRPHLEINLQQYGAMACTGAICVALLHLCVPFVTLHVKNSLAVPVPH